MAELIDISNDKFWAILFDEACVEGQQAERIEKALKAISTTEAEIRAKAEHTYENCHNITCRRKCQKDGYNMAIDEFARKLLINFNDWQMSVAEVGNEKEYETIGKAIIGIEEIAEKLKERE